MKEDLNRRFDECYLLTLDDEELLYESIVVLTKEFKEGKIPSELYVKSLDIANVVVQDIHSRRTALHKLIKQIRYHLFKMKEYIEINYEDGMDFIVIPNQEYTKLYNDFLTRSHHFFKEWNQYEKEHGLCIPEMTSEIRSFELVFKMIQLLLEEYDAHTYPSQELLHIYTLTRQVSGLLMNARDLAINMKPQIIADQYYMRKYLSKLTYAGFNSNLQPHRHDPDFEYVREPGMPINTGFTNNFGMERRRHFDLVPESQMHQLMTGDIGQFQSNQFNETKHFKSKLFEAGLGLRTYQPTKRHPLQETGQMGETSDNINPYPRPHYHPESHSEESSAATPPGPKLERPNTRCTSPNYTFVQPTMENEARRKARSGSGQPVWPHFTDSILDD